MTRLLRIQDYLKNGNVYSFLFYSDSLHRSIHVDLISVSSVEDFLPQYEYLNYGDFSGILGVMARRLHFNYGTEGMYKIYIDKSNRYHYILITKNLREGLQILGYKDILDTFDNIKTLELVESLKPYKTFIVPNLFIPLEEALLSDERRKDLHELSETQWDIIASAWKHNISVWADQAEYKNYSIIARAAALALIPFIKNKHGNKAIRPVMKFAGITLGKHISPEKCDSKLCK